jgi:hypothetical protein
MLGKNFCWPKWRPKSLWINRDDGGTAVALHQPFTPPANLPQVTENHTPQLADVVSQ